MLNGTKPLAFVFWILNRMFKVIYDDGFSDVKALAVIVCSELLILMGVLCIAFLGVGYRFLPVHGALSFVMAGALSLAVTGLNYYALCYENRWIRFKAEFETYSVTTRVFSGLAITAVVFGIILASMMAAAAASHLPTKRASAQIAFPSLKAY